MGDEGDGVIDFNVFGEYVVGLVVMCGVLFFFK